MIRSGWGPRGLDQRCPAAVSPCALRCLLAAPPWPALEAPRVPLRKGRLHCDAPFQTRESQTLAAKRSTLAGVRPTTNRYHLLPRQLQIPLPPSPELLRVAKQSSRKARRSKSELRQSTTPAASQARSAPAPIATPRSACASAFAAARGGLPGGPSAETRTTNSRLCRTAAPPHIAGGCGRKRRTKGTLGDRHTRLPGNSRVRPRRHLPSACDLQRRGGALACRTRAPSHCR